MCSIDDLVDHVAGCRVNDEQDSSSDDYVVWKKDVIKKTAREAISAVYGLRPDLFAEKREVTLTQDSCLHSFCEDCCRITDVIIVDGKSCNEIEEHKDENDDRSLDFLDCYFTDNCDLPNADKECHDPDSYDPGSWKSLPSTPCTVRFDNATPSDRDVQATVMCVPSSVIDADTDKVLPCIVCGELFQPIIDNILFRLYSIDHKDGNALEIADRHWRAFTTTMTTKFDVDFSLHENNYHLTKRKVSDHVFWHGGG